VFDLEGAAKQRFRHHFGSIEGLEASSGNSPLSQPVPVVSFGEYEDADSEFGRTIKKVKLLGGLLSGIRNTDITKIDDAIERGRTILASSDLSTVPDTQTQQIL